MRTLLASILDIYQQGAESLVVNGWTIRRAAQGMNGLVYRAAKDGRRDLAVKISQIDERDRTGREYAATLALSRLELGVCPMPIYYAPKPKGLPGGVVISSWLEGTRLEAAPEPDDRATWMMILEAMSLAHRLLPSDASVTLRDAVIPVMNPADLTAYIRGQFALLPEGTLGGLEHGQVASLVERMADSTPPEWDYYVSRGLIRSDPNPQNMLVDGAVVRLVDWENAGWGDPAFEMGEMFVHPAYIHLSETFRAEMWAQHAELMEDKRLPERAAVYRRMMLVFWVVRWSRYLVEPLNRLSGATPAPREHTLSQQARYWELARAAFG